MEFDERELTEEELDHIIGGVPTSVAEENVLKHPELFRPEEVERIIRKRESERELTEEELDLIRAGYPEEKRKGR